MRKTVVVAAASADTSAQHNGSMLHEVCFEIHREIAKKTTRLCPAKGLRHCCAFLFTFLILFLRNTFLKIFCV